MDNWHSKMQLRRQGFTLIELSIVLVIIGLIVGGVLVGRDLIEAATLRKVASEYETYNTAILTFKHKYNCLPGDCPNATQLALLTMAMGTALLIMILFRIGHWNNFTYGLI